METVLRKPVGMPEGDYVQITRENFDEVGEWLGVEECWGLDSPEPTLWLQHLNDRAARIGDWVGICDKLGFQMWGSSECEWEI